MLAKTGRGLGPAADADRVDRHVRSFRSLQDVLVPEQARRVLAVRKEDEGLPSRGACDRAPHALKFVQGDVDRRVQCGGASGARPPDSSFEETEIGRERLQDFRLAVEADDLREIHGSEAAAELDGCVPGQT